MNNTWRWIIGIVVGLAIIGLVLQSIGQAGL
jgi:hypothetical protein